MAKEFFRRLATRLLSVLAFAYFVLDGVVFWLVRAAFTHLARLALIERLGAWVRRFPPYVALASFLIPLIILEPAKPVGAWLIAQGHITKGFAVLAIAELLKIVLVERLFHLNRDKLLSIPAFAWAYRIAMRWLGWWLALPGVQAAMRLMRNIRRVSQTLWRKWRPASRRSNIHR